MMINRYKGASKRGPIRALDLQPWGRAFPRAGLGPGDPYRACC